MATIEITVISRVNTGTTASPVQAFINTTSSVVTVSQYIVEQLILATGASNVNFSNANFSNPNNVLLMATSTMRVNIANRASMVSAGSAGDQFREFYMLTGSGISGPLALNFANSGGDSATVTIILGM